MRQDKADTHDGKGGDKERGRKRKDEVNIFVIADWEANVEQVNDRSNSSCVLTTSFLCRGK